MAFPMRTFFLISLITFLTIATRVKCNFFVPAMFVFGDSLADVGNNNNLTVPIQDRSNHDSYGIDLPNGVSTGRFTNGLNAVDFAAKYLMIKNAPPAYLTVKDNVDQMLKGVNFASAGSGILDSTGPGTLSMAMQIKYFEKVVEALKKKMGEDKAKRLIRRSVFMIVMGSNDMFEYYYKTGAQDKNARNKFPGDLARMFIFRHIMALQKLGMKKVYITGLGPLGCVPFFRTKTKNGDCLEELNETAKQYNMVAKRTLVQTCLKMPGFVKYSFLDAYGIAKTMMKTPWLFGIHDIRDACCGGGKFYAEQGCNGNASICKDRSSYFFWDQFHPTETSAKIAARLGIFGAPIYSSPMNLLQLATGA
ncbi:hypothetical protein LUZ60_007920 [Juncus effusus]|nr:hypothetical protein LUZ60_007920 [Juncus effusus]